MSRLPTATAQEAAATLSCALSAPTNHNTSCSATATQTRHFMLTVSFTPAAYISHRIEHKVSTVAKTW